MRRFVLAAFALTVLTACQAPPPEMTEADVSQIESEMTTLDQAVVEAVKVSDLDAFLGFFSDDLTWALFGEVHHGLDSWAQQVTPFFLQGERLDRCDYLNRRVQVLARDVAISTWVSICFAPSPEGPVLVDDHTWTAVWAKKDGQWKIVNVSETYKPPETEG